MRGFLSHYPMIYALVGGVGIVSFWRGVWETSDLLGIPYRVIVSEKTLAKKSVELKERAKSKFEIVKISQLIKKLNV